MLQNLKRHMTGKELPGAVLSLPVLLALLLMAAACGPVAPAAPTAGAGAQSTSDTAVPAEPASGDTADTAYPVPQSPVSADAAGEAYPVATLVLPTATPFPDVYPPPAETFEEPRFQFDLPLRAGATEVSGQAPPGLTLAIVDVTFNGELLGSGVTKADGTFSINTQELPDGHRVGVTFGELEPGLTIADMSIKYFPHRGDNFMNIPNVGIMLETALVEP
jgi:hypothetical protein